MADIRDEHGRPIQLTDEFGHPVQLTDEHGVPIQLTGVATAAPHGQMTIGSELHNKTIHDQGTQTTTGSETHGGTHFAPTPVDYVKRGAGAVAGAGAATVGAVAGVGKAATGAVTGTAPGSHDQHHATSHDQHHAAGDDKKQLERSNSSSSSSSEDDGQGGRRKKKGLMQKIKDKLPGHSDKAAHSPGTDEKISRVEHRHEQEQEKKGFMDKIKDKLPGHH